MNALGEHAFWISSRAAGTVALLASSLAVCIGLLMSGAFKRAPSGAGAGQRDRRVRAPVSTLLRPLHEALSVATIIAIAVHALLLLGDSFLRPSLADITIPFVSGYMEPWNSIGIVSGWVLAILGLSYYARARIGVQRWRRLHRLTAIAWIGGIAHSLGEGTDAGEAWFLVSTAIVTIPALVLLVVRHARPGGGVAVAQSWASSRSRSALSFQAPTDARR